MRVVLGGGDQWSQKQFCSRLVAQAYGSRGHKLVDDANYCSPNELLKSGLLVEIADGTRPATIKDLEFEGLPDLTQMMRDATERLLEGARAKNPAIADLNGIDAHLIKVPEDDEYLHDVLRKSGYLDVWLNDVERNPWHYDLELMEGISEHDELLGYCRQTVVDAGGARHRYARNATGYADLFAAHPLGTFGELAALYAHLERLHAIRRHVAAEWLSNHAPDTVPAKILSPHSAEWFTELETHDPRKAVATRTVLDLIGREDVCSICGDDPALDYRLAGPALPGEFVPTLRLCDDCLGKRGQSGEDFVPLAGDE